MINIRGEGLPTNNSPLFVVNGVPINNDNGGNGRSEGNLETDYGNGAAEINPEDIETISILKGANATALYGSRAANGVVLITTKTGANKKGSVPALAAATPSSAHCVSPNTKTGTAREPAATSPLAMVSAAASTTTSTKTGARPSVTR